jgi:Protein of unknown function (DUF1569)
MSQEKLHFITTQFVALLQTANANTAPKWGKMNLQQMVEHVADFFRVSSGNIQFPILTPEEHLPKYKAFLHTDKEFRENTKAPAEVLPDEPLPVRNNNMEAAIKDLQEVITGFINFFDINKNAVTNHPVFGSLNFDEWILLHYKHVSHHARQFGLL